ncbi:MAG: PBSX family phage terminase large subunit, partial [Candidatus Peribacteraceae bacterium]|nr:PBSX family phage terminase large subunit [Candidatus Peribacteraceae bacterium]
MSNLLSNNVIDSEVKVVGKHYNFLLKTEKRKNHLWGSAGSAKSWSVAQYLIFEIMCKAQDVRIIVTRKTGPALSKSAWLLVQDLLKRYEIPFQINKTDKVIFIGTNEMYFVALDDPDKLRSFERINYVWAEEAAELFHQDYMQLGLRCRGENKHGKNRLFFTYNPTLKPWNGYLKKITEQVPADTGVLHSTWRDNPFLPEEYLQELALLKDQDETYYQIYSEGKWASAQNLVYDNWEIITKWPDFLNAGGYGLDFGYNAPTALLKCGFDPEMTTLYVKELLYERLLTNQSLIENRLPNLIDDRIRPIVADCAAPEKIQEILDANYNIFPCSKGKSSIKIGIDRVKRYRMKILKGSTNLQDELNIYKWREDATG